MRFVLALTFSMVTAGMGFAQKIHDVQEVEQQVNAIPRKGLQLVVELDQKFVAKHWEKTLKDQKGKYTLTKGIYTVEGAKIPSIAQTPIKILSKVDATKEGTVVWYSLDLGNAYVNKEGDEKAYEAAEGFLQNFARLVHREDLNLQVAEAEKVLVRTQEEYQRTVKGADEIKAKIAKNAESKRLLEQQLVANSDELLRLQKETEVNLQAQETAKQQVDNMKQALDIVKGKASSL